MIRCIEIHCHDLLQAYPEFNFSPAALPPSSGVLHQWLFMSQTLQALSLCIPIYQSKSLQNIIHCQHMTRTKTRSETSPLGSPVGQKAIIYQQQLTKERHL